MLKKGRSRFMRVWKNWATHFRYCLKLFSTYFFRFDQINPILEHSEIPAVNIRYRRSLSTSFNDDTEHLNKVEALWSMCTLIHGSKISLKESISVRPYRNYSFDPIHMNMMNVSQSYICINSSALSCICFDHALFQLLVNNNAPKLSLIMWHLSCKR